MNQISLDAKGGQFLADLANWQRESAPDNSADLERLRYALAVQRDEYLPLHVIRERLARLDADVEAPAPQPVARVVARDGRIVDDGPMDLEALLAHSGASESQIEELVAVGLISPDEIGRASCRERV